MADTVTLAASDITLEELVAELRHMRSTFEGEGIAAMSLFGSRARQDNRRESDIDLLVDIAEGRKFSLLDLVGVGTLVEDHFRLPANIFIRSGLDKQFLDVARVDEVEVF